MNQAVPQSAPTDTVVLVGVEPPQIADLLPVRGIANPRLVPTGQVDAVPDLAPALVFCAWPSPMFDRLDGFHRSGRLAAPLIAVPVRSGRRRAPRPFDDFVDAVAAIVFEADPRTRRCTFVSRHAERVLGHPLAAWSEPGFWPTHLHPEDRDAALAVSWDRAGQDHEVTYRMRAADGRWVWLHERTRIVALPAGSSVACGILVDVTAAKEVETRQRAQARIVELIARGTSLSQTLTELLRDMEGRDPGLLTSILLLDDDGRHLRHGAAPSLPAEYCRLVDGFPVGPGQACCGTAVWRRATVIVEDILTDPLWAPFRGLIAPFGLRSCWSSPIFDADGRVLGTFAIYHRHPARPTDLHRQWIAEATHTAAICISRARVLQALRDEELQTCELIENAIDAIVTIDDQGVVTRWNAQAERLLGHPRTAVLGQPLPEILAPERDRPARAAALRSALTDLALGSPGQHLERTARRADGAEIPVEIALTRTQTGGRTYVTAFLRDLTERRQAEATRRSLEHQLQIAQRMEALGTLAGGVAHEFNNLLAVILGNAELAGADPAVHDETRRYLGEIGKAATRATSLTRQILQFGRRQLLQRQAVELPTVVHDSIAMLRATLPAGVALHVDLASNTPAVLADATEIHQVVLNLCTNSWQALCDGHGRITVAVRGQDLDAAAAARLPGLHPGPHAVLEVADDGIGMDDATRERIFEPFFTTKAGGTGLGLAVVHGIVRNHDGALQVDSAPGRGTTIRVWLPAANGSAEIPTVETGATPRGRRERVLVVDDEPMLLQILTRSLTRLGYAPVPFQCPEDALAALQADPHAADLVLTDHSMPGLSGLEFAAAVRRVCPGLPILLASGLLTDETKATAVRLGVRGIIAKPVTAHELGQALHAALHRGRGTEA